MDCHCCASFILQHVFSCDSANENLFCFLYDQWSTHANTIQLPMQLLSNMLLHILQTPEYLQFSKCIYSPFCSFFSFIYCLYLCLCMESFCVYLSVWILHTYYIISLRMLMHSVINCIREQTSSVGKTCVRSIFVIFSKYNYV